MQIYNNIFNKEVQGTSSLLKLNTQQNTQCQRKIGVLNYWYTWALLYHEIKLIMLFPVEFGTCIWKEKMEERTWLMADPPLASPGLCKNYLRRRGGQRAAASQWHALHNSAL